MAGPKYLSEFHQYDGQDEDKHAHKIQKNKPIDYGYHDQCIFLFDTKILLAKLEIIIQKKYDELNLLEVVEYFDNIKYYETDYKVDSFNTIDELNNNKKNI